MPEPKAVRFRPALDIILLKEVLSVLVEDGKLDWEAIHRKLNDKIQETNPDICIKTPRNAKDRYNNLLDSFKNAELVSLRASGTDEEYEERRRLLTEIQSKNEEKELVKEAESRKNKRKIEQGKAIIKAALENCKPKKAASSDVENDEEDGPPPPDLDLEEEMETEPKSKGNLNPARAAKKRKTKEDLTADYISVMRERNVLDAEKLQLEKEKQRLDAERANAQNELMMKLVESLTKKN